MKNRFFKRIEPRFFLSFIALFIFSAVSYAFADARVAIAETVVSIIVLAVFIITSDYRERRLHKSIEETYNTINQANRDATMVYPMAMAVIRKNGGDVVWSNSAFADMAGVHDYVFEKKLFDLIPEFDLGWVTEGKRECPAEIPVSGKMYKVFGNLFYPENSVEDSALITLYWLDVSEYAEKISDFENARQIVSVIMIDNYAEIMNGLNDAERSIVIAEVDKRLAEWTAPANGIFMRYDRERYLFVFHQAYFEKYTSEKFSILDSVREIQSKNGIKVTLSIGVGKDGQNFKENHRNARLAIDMALSRGGDQAVIRDKFSFEFFGGRSQELEKRTKVKSRVMANALEGLIKDSSGVIIMGHKSADNDSIGAAIGIACIARKVGKSASIVIGQKSSADALIRKIKTEHTYDGAFISAEDALLEADSDTLLVVVDTNRKTVVESEALLESANKIAVIDHHRRGADYIEDAVLNFHEPYASSTCELVAELLQYIVETRDVLSCEAEALLSGIVIDTKNFTMKTGVRTFEAAAYLRRAGADTTELKRILQDDIETYVARAELVKLAKMYHDRVAIVEYDGRSDRKIAAQAADDLLTIQGVQAAFVLYGEQGDVNISARSLGDINVQVILEKLGGGGHFDTAGAQLRDTKLEDAASLLKNAIDEVLG
ncbi:MAG: DHH family phosphoesterase [Oscillospiraceae bacterium]|nr:DHH family phosphoesterase [Oscillospiraceae bacterium]